MSILTREGNALADGSTKTNMAAPLGVLKAGDLWHSSAPAAVRNDWDSEADGAAWRCWVRHTGQKPLLPLEEGSPLETLSWGLPSDSPAASRLKKIKKLIEGKSTQKDLSSALETWAESALLGEQTPTLDAAIETLAWAYSAASVAERLEAGVWLRMLETICSWVESAVNQPPDENEGADGMLLYQLVGCETPLVLGTLLAEMRPMRDLRKQAVRDLSESLLVMTDGEGLPPARCLEHLPMFLASWIRCRAIAESTDKKCWSDEAETQYEWLVRQSLRLARPDGTLALSNDAALPTSAWSEAIETGGDLADIAAASRRLRPRPVAASEAEGEEPPAESVNSEWSGLAVLGGGWGAKSPRLTVAYEGQQMRLELATAGEVVASGAWPIDVTIAGTSLAATDDWEEQCWFSDEDSDYLEVAIDLDNDIKLERQIFLARDGSIAYLSEIILTEATQPEAIEVCTRLQLGGDVYLQAEKKTRDGWLVRGDKRLAGVAPLGLPEWRDDPRLGELEVVDDELCLSQSAVGLNLCSPLAIDFKPGRFAKQRTWRQLAVAEQLERVTPDVAVGYRFQSGKDQWLVYRSLQPAANRTVIGQNYSSESLIGRFLPDGEVDEYFEIESERD